MKGPFSYVVGSCVLLAAGFLLQAQQRTQPAASNIDQPNIRDEVNMVLVTASVTDADHHTIDNLRREDFTLLDEGEPRAIEYFARDIDVPLTIGILVDVSGSQRHFLDRHRSEVLQFLAHVLQPGDRAFLASVGGNPRLVVDLTDSAQDLRDGIEALTRNRNAGERLGDGCRFLNNLLIVNGKMCIASPLWNGVFAVARLKLKPVEGRKAIIMLSDGADTGSQHSLTDAIEAAQGANAPVYAIVSSDTSLGRFGQTPPMLVEGRDHLKRLAEETGGRSFITPMTESITDASNVFSQIEDELRSLYVLGFTAPPEAGNGKFRQLEVQVHRPGVHVRARKGYTEAIR